MEADVNQQRDSVPLTRPLSLVSEAGTQRWEFDVGPPGKNSGASLVLGFRICLPDSERLIAAERALFDAPPAVEIRLVSVGNSSPPMDVPLVYVDGGGGPSGAELLPVPENGRVEAVRRASLDELSMSEAGLGKEASRCSVLAFARAMRIDPGHYRLSITPRRFYSPPADAHIELVVAYFYRGK